MTLAQDGLVSTRQASHLVAVTILFALMIQKPFALQQQFECVMYMSFAAARPQRFVVPIKVDADTMAVEHRNDALSWQHLGLAASRPGSIKVAGKQSLLRFNM